MTHHADLLAQLEFFRDIGVRAVEIDLARLGRDPVSDPASEPNLEAGGSPRMTLEDVRGDLGDCKRCKLARTRSRIVFGSGSGEADLVFVGEAPGFEEDRQGLPFVGRAGQLLTKIIESIGLERSNVYICNVLKCRPPDNRNPEPEEVETCSPFLRAQLASIQPRIVCCLGTFAAHTVMGTKVPISRLRGQFHDIAGVRYIATFHPAYLLRNPEKKREVWEDMKQIRNALRTAHPLS